MLDSASAKEKLDREFLEIRHRLLSVAASLDRITSSPSTESLEQDHRWQDIRTAADTLIDGQPDRAKRVQMLFSLPYDSDWRSPVEGK